MPFAMVLLMVLALSVWLGGTRQRKRRREETRREIEATLATGLPSDGTALGRTGHAVATGAREKLGEPPPIHGSARWARAAGTRQAMTAMPSR